jgi:hypothetical protein
MADAPGTPTPASDPKAETKTGPVKPPVLEGTARPAGKTDEAKPDKKDAPEKTKPAASTASPTRPPASSAPKRPERDDEGGGAWLAGILGGVIGLVAAYGLAFFGLWPTTAPAPTTPDPRIAQLASAVPELETVTSTVQDELATLNGRVSELEASASEPVAAPGPDQNLAALEARVEELAASAAPADDDALAALRADLDALSQQLADNRASIEAVTADLAALSETTTSFAENDGNAARLPLIFSGLESAFGSGRSFEAELAALDATLPDAPVPQAIAARAPTGLPRPDDVARQLDAVLPDMLAGRPASEGAGWQEATGDWFRGVIAMRPAGAVDGNGPDAIVARLEAAVAARDFAAAQTEFAALPSSMQAAAVGLGDDLALLAEAAAMLGDLRSTALDNGAAQ